MAKEPRPKGYPKLKNYKPSQFMLPTSHYDKKKADRAVTFIENLCHTKGKWAGTPFWLLPWQEQLIRDIFGIVKPDGNRQFRTAFVEICKKVGKSELAAAVALYLLYADNEPSAEVYGAAADRQQASIVFDVAKQMVEMSPALMKRSKLMGATKRIVNYSNAGYYQVLSAEVGGKHGFSVSGLVFDEIHTQPNRQLYDVLTKGSSDARQNPLHFIITTAGNDRHSIAYELHTKAVDILEGRRVDPTFYPVVYGLKDDEDWEDEENWYKVNPSLGYTVDIERLRDAYREAKQNPADEVTFKWLRCNMWVSSTVAWIPDAIYMRGNESIEAASLEGRDCYAGLDLSSTGDITALVLIFPPRDENEKYVLLPYFWIPEETIPRRVKANSVPYDIWEKQGYIMSTEGNVIHYDFIEKFIMYLSEKYHILEIAVDRWNATQMIQNLEGEGFTIVPFGQGFSSMSAPTKEFYRLLMEGRIIHGGNPVLRWMAGNVVIDTDPAGNIKVDGLVGYSPIAMAKNAIGLAIAAEEYGSKFYANGAAPSGVLEHPGTLKDPGRVRESWQSTFGGSSNANKVAVLEEGMKYTPISIAPNEAQFLETRKFQIDEIARIFRVPPHMVGDLDKSSFSNIEQQSLEFVKYTLDPWVSRWEQAMVRALLSAEEKKKYFFKFNVDGLLRGDYQSRMTGYATARQNGWMSANDIRELENMDRIPEELGGDLYLINGNMTKLQDAGIFAGSGKGKDTGEEVLELEKESGKFGKRTGS